MNEENWIEMPEYEQVRRDMRAAIKADYQRIVAHVAATPRRNLLSRIWSMWTGQ